MWGRTRSKCGNACCCFLRQLHRLFPDLLHLLPPTVSTPAAAETNPEFLKTVKMVAAKDQPAEFATTQKLDLSKLS